MAVITSPPALTWAPSIPTVASPADEARVGGRAVGGHLLDQHALVDVEVEDLGELGVEVGPLDPEVGVLDGAAVDDLLRRRSWRC